MSTPAPTGTTRQDCLFPCLDVSDALSYMEARIPGSPCLWSLQDPFEAVPECQHPSGGPLVDDSCGPDILKRLPRRSSSSSRSSTTRSGSSSTQQTCASPAPTVASPTRRLLCSSVGVCWPASLVRQGRRSTARPARTLVACPSPRVRQARASRASTPTSGERVQR